MKAKTLLALFIATSLSAIAAEHRLQSPDGKITVVVSDEGGLRYSVAVDGKPVLSPSLLGLEFDGGVTFGPATKISGAEPSTHDGTWQNAFGIRRTVKDHWNQIQLKLTEPGEPARHHGLIVRAYDNGVALRYDLPAESGLGAFTLKRELTEFTFAGDYRCWAGEPSDCAENQYPEGKLAAIPTTFTKDGKTDTYKSTLPLLVEAPECFVAVAESDLHDWAGMFLTGTGKPAVGITLAARNDGRGCVVSQTPRVSPWRVLMIGRKAGDLVDSDLIANLATPSKIKDSSWIKPGLCAWDPWWTGINPHMAETPETTGLYARIDTKAGKEFIDFAAEMGWSYQLVDWMWYKDCTSYEILLNLGRTNPPRPPVNFEISVPDVDMPGLLAHAKSKNVRLMVWVHSYDIERYGIDKACKLFSSWGVAGLKIDFMNNDGQETMAWYENLISIAAGHKLLIDFHGACKPSGLNRTWPNYITQEGVLGNEYNKFSDKCPPLHTVTLPFTRGLLGPMDVTPGGFINRTPADFKQTYPAQVMGSRVRQLAMPVLYPSPLTVFCDSPTNYRGADGIEFYRGLPTVWDETVVLKAEVASQIVIARRSGDRWWLAAMNGDEAANIEVPLAFLGSGDWSARGFADTAETATKPTVLEEKTIAVKAGDTYKMKLAPAGGHAAVFSKTL